MENAAAAPAPQLTTKRFRRTMFPEPVARTTLLFSRFAQSSRQRGLLFFHRAVFHPSAVRARVQLSLSPGHRKRGAILRVLASIKLPPAQGM